jgi:hypothetical protein
MAEPAKPAFHARWQWWKSANFNPDWINLTRHDGRAGHLAKVGIAWLTN